MQRNSIWKDSFLLSFCDLKKLFKDFDMKHGARNWKGEVLELPAALKFHKKWLHFNHLNEG